MIFKTDKSEVINMDEPRIWALQSVNRSQRRKSEQEYDQSDPELAELEDTFLGVILNQEGVFSDVSYKVVYGDILAAYERLLMWIERRRKPVATKLNYEYFVNNYKPIESECTPIWTALHMKIRQMNYIPGQEMIVGKLNLG